MYRILIIEDEEDIKENLQEIFEVHGHKVRCAANGDEGLAAALKYKPDLIICDITMPGKDGFEVKRKLSENRNTHSIPFIFLTAKADLNSMREGMSLGSDDYIVKPIPAKDLIKHVNTRMQRIKSFKAGNEKEATEKRITSDDKISLFTGKDHLLVTVNYIVVITVKQDYSSVFLSDGRKVMIKRSIKSWEEMLPSKIFIKAHRNILLNLNYVEKIEPWFNNTLMAKLKNYSEPILFSKRCSYNMKKFLKEI